MAKLGLGASPGGPFGFEANVGGLPAKDGFEANEGGRVARVELEGRALRLGGRELDGSPPACRRSARIFAESQTKERQQKVKLLIGERFDRG